MNGPSRNSVRSLIATAFLLPALGHAQMEYALGKGGQYTQTGSNTVQANTGAAFQFDALSSLTGSLTLPNGQSDPLVYLSNDNAYEVLQNFDTQAAMDQAFPSGSYTFSSSGQTTAKLTLTGDLYPPVPQIIDGTWDASGNLLVDPTSDYVLNFNPFLGYATAGVLGEVLFTVSEGPGVDAVNSSWISRESPQVPTGTTIPAGTLTPGTYYSATLTYASDTTFDETSVPGAVLFATYARLTTFEILTQASPTTLPVATSEPASQIVASGSTVVFNFSASGSPAPSYQWYRDGAPLASATQAALVISGTTAADEGNYYCIAGNPSGSVESDSASLSISTTSDIGRLINISCRAHVGTGGGILIAGFAIGGLGTEGAEQLLIRGSGPALAPFGVTGAIPDPQLQLYSGSTVLGTNNGWAGNFAIASAASAAGAFAWNVVSSHDSALLEGLSSGPYTAQIAGQSGDTGVALVEVYDATPLGTYSPATPRLVNISARVQVGTGGNILIAGFVIGGATSKTVLIRASGPALVPFGVSGTLSDPMLQLYSGAKLLATKSGWGGNPQIAGIAASVGAFAWSNPASNDSAILVTLPPGAYTAQVAGSSGDTGVALAEVYEVP